MRLLRLKTQITNKRGVLFSICFLIPMAVADDIDLYGHGQRMVPESAYIRQLHNNQVYIGMFSPAQASRWSGNLKLYQLGWDSNHHPILLDADAVPAVKDDQFSDKARSYWTFAQDSPDGKSAALGGAAQSLKAYVAQHRINLTCTGPCIALEPYGVGNTDLTPSDFGAEDPAEMEAVIAWSKQGHGDVIHSRPAIINYGEKKGLYAFYGSNDGMFHSTKVGPTEKSEQVNSNHGEEQWAFTAPQQFKLLTQMYRARGDATAAKSYFFDNPVAVHLSSDPLAEGGTAIIYLTARRGGRMIYALNVTDPKVPKIQWHRSNVDQGWAELGQTWSVPVIKPLRLSDDSEPKQGLFMGLFMGLGYDEAAEDSDGPRTQGRGVVIVNALTGQIIWQMTDIPFAVAGDLGVIDQDHDGNADRVYFGDTGGQLWRLDLSSGDSSKWSAQVLFKLPGGQKFLTAPDIVASPDGTYNAIIIGSGDREKPFSTAVQDYLVLYRDRCVGKPSVGCKHKVRGIGDLQNRSLDSISEATAGWYQPLQPGEKVVTRAVTANSQTTLASYRACATPVCSGFGEARVYNFKPFSFPKDQQIPPRAIPYSLVKGGGILPEPIPINIEADRCSGEPCSAEEKLVTAVIFGPHIEVLDSESLGVRRKVWFYKRF